LSALGDTGFDEDKIKYDKIYSDIENASKDADQIVIPKDVDTKTAGLIKLAIKQGEKQADGYKKGINVADAAVYVSPTFYRDLMRMIGEWGDKQEFGYNLMAEEGKLFLTTK